MLRSDAVILPTNVKPTRYRLTLEPNLGDFTFTGEETLDIEVLEATDEITLNSAEIAIQSCAVSAGGQAPTSPRDIVFDQANETVTLKLEHELPAGPARLEFKFTGELNDRLRGFYRSHYRDVDGNEQYLATTQFEATDARRAFPCWDEPSLKATFDVTLVIPTELVPYPTCRSPTSARSGRASRRSASRSRRSCRRTFSPSWSETWRRWSRRPLTAR